MNATRQPFRLDASLRDRWSRSGDVWSFTMPEGWAQGRTVFGGLTAAAIAALARLHVDEARALRTVNLQMMRPIAAGDVDATVRVVREGKYTSFVSVELFQDGEVCTAASLVFVAHREGATDVAETSVDTSLPPVDTLRDLPAIPGAVPEFVRNAQLRWARGAWPYAGSDEAAFDAYCRFHTPAGHAEGVLATLDLFPAPSLAVLTSPAPASTVTWTAHIIEAPDDLSMWSLFSYRTVVGRGGMHTVCGELRTTDGKLLAWTEQLAAVFG